MNIVSHFLLDEECRVEILDVALSQARSIALCQLGLREVDIAFAQAALNCTQVSLMRSFDALISVLELIQAFKLEFLLWVEMSLHFVSLINYKL